MSDYKKIDLFIGWGIFLAGFVTYALTVEPTASFWDCGEYIATSAKLQVGHPPGAPFFQILGAFFAMFSPSPEKVALIVNYMSVVSSAFTLMFMYLTTVNLLTKMAAKTSSNGISSRNLLAIRCSGIVGAFAFMFSDSFWFNAVEAEVYAMATFMMALMFWMALRWIDDIDKPRGNRWLVMISLLVGLSFGVHFMALLTIPAIGMIYYFKKFPTPTLKGFIIANILSVCLLLFVFKLLLPYTLAFFGYLEVFFVNSIGMPFHSGTIIAGLIITGTFFFLLKYTRKYHYVHANTAVLCVFFVFVGFSMWIMLPIRANANTIINENSPSDARLLLAYYNLEQYPETHLFYGPMFTDAYVGQDEKNPYTDDKPKYEKDKKSGKYVVVNNWKNARIAPNSTQEGLLPRLWSPEHAKGYMDIVGLIDFSVNPEYADSRKLNYLLREFKTKMNNGEISPEEELDFINKFKGYLKVEKPGFWQNIHYLISFQMNYMYWRYFMWNFVGRQDDIVGKMDDHGNWLSGVKFIDEVRLGSQRRLPSDVIDNKARNTYYFLPLILGLIGVVFLFKRDKHQFWILLMLFAFMGLALKIYLNERAFEPRERDYALVGSFYIFAMWIGYGVYALFDELSKKVSSKALAPVVGVICFISVPVLMASENWDDHDRSGRYTAQFMAKAYLDSVQEDVGAMLFTIGDNDTFALWYAQEIEGYRTDVRTINTSLLAADWYIDQMKRKAYESDPIPSKMEHSEYAYGVRDAVYYKEGTDSRWDIKTFMNWVRSGDNRTKTKFSSLQEAVVFYPTNKIRVKVNKVNAIESGLVKVKDSARIVDYIDIDLPKTVLTKNRLIMLDILANNDWKRPIYFTGGSFDDSEYIWMKDYLQLDGLTYKLVPIKTPMDKDNPFDMGRIDTDRAFEIISDWDWGNSGRSDIYHDPETRKNSISYRGTISKLADSLISENKFDKAEQMLDLAIHHTPVDFYGYYTTLNDFVRNYYMVGAEDKARKLFLEVSKKYREYLNYYSTLGIEWQYNNSIRIIKNMERYREMLKIVGRDTDKMFFDEQIGIFDSYISRFPYLYEEEEKFRKEENSKMPIDSIARLLEESSK